jgi:ABC-type amino acid transport system permease subunit
MNGDDRAEMTVGMKVMVTVAFVCVVGLFIGLAGLMGDWLLAKSIGAVCLAVLAAIIWGSFELIGSNMMDRFLYGRKDKTRDNKDA